jgi:drug/metabolite transporter (DMT)-like permease
LSNTAAILQATPLVVIAGAALLFGEKVGWKRWVAVLVGFGGVLIILRPWVEGFTPLSILAVLGTIGFAGRDLATRAAPRVLSNWQLGIYGFAMMVPAGIGLLIWSGGAVIPNAFATICLIGGVLIGVMAYAALTEAMRTGEVSAVTPFRYSRLLFAMALGVLVFKERPDALTLIGSAVVVISGLYTFALARRG